MREQERVRLGEFWLDKRADGTSDAWQITWYDSAKRQTRQRSTRTSDLKLAERRLAEHYIAHGKRTEEPAAQVLIAPLLDRYFERYAKQLPSAEVVSDAI